MDSSMRATQRVTMRVDGDNLTADIDRPGESLLSTLRNRLGRTGTKNACEQGECGSCTVLLDGDPVCACLVATAQCHGRDIRTVASAVPRALRDAFIACGAVQCGFCTPGLLVAAADLLSRDADPGEAQIREALAGNLCRCTGYEKIIEAVHTAAATAASEATAAATTPEADRSQADRTAAATTLEADRSQADRTAAATTLEADRSQADRTAAATTPEADRSQADRTAAATTPEADRSQADRTESDSPPPPPTRSGSTGLDRAEAARTEARHARLAAPEAMSFCPCASPPFPLASASTVTPGCDNSTPECAQCP